MPSIYVRYKSYIIYFFLLNPSNLSFDCPHTYISFVGKRLINIFIWMSFTLRLILPSTRFHLCLIVFMQFFLFPHICSFRLDPSTNNILQSFLPAAHSSRYCISAILLYMDQCQRNKQIIINPLSGNKSV